MNILLLGPLSPVLRGILEQTDRVLEWNRPVDEAFFKRHPVDFIVSYRYRYLLKKPVLEAVGGRALNLHISLLPWNRGADPNLWSFLEDTPKGVSIHWMDEGIDTGDILAQQEVRFRVRAETLRTTYEQLDRRILSLFGSVWFDIRSGRLRGVRQAGRGSYHTLHDKTPFLDLLTEGWDTPVAALVGKANIHRTKVGRE